MEWTLRILLCVWLIQWPLVASFSWYSVNSYNPGYVAAYKRNGLTRRTPWELSRDQRQKPGEVASGRVAGSSRLPGEKPGGGRSGERTGSIRAASCITLTAPQTISSPNYPSRYPNNAEVCWKLQGSAGQYPEVEFLTFNLERHSSCRYDSVSIYNHGTEMEPFLIGKYCHTSNPGLVTASGQELLIVFRSDYSVTKTGFEANVRFSSTPGNHPSLCTEYDSPGQLESQNHPGSYINHLYQCWIIRAPVGEEINLDFDAFNVEYHRSCNYDSLEVFRGLSSSDSDRVGNKLCGSSNPGPIPVTDNVAFLQFKTDYSVTRSGFRINFSFSGSGGGGGGGGGGGEGGGGSIEVAGCGISVPPSERIINGIDAVEGQFPWQLSLQTLGGSHFCGAVLLSEDYVVTAAHCVEGGGQINVVAGLLEHSSSGRAEFFQMSKTDFQIHPNYPGRPIDQSSDIAVARLPRAANLDDPNITPACIPSGPISDYVGNPDCFISGWGKIQHGGGGPIPNHLQYTPTNVLSTSQCQSYAGSIGDRFTCVLNTVQNSGACFGDSGGPLVCQRNGRYELVGVTSFVFGGCSTSHPTFYASLPHFLSWVTDELLDL